MGSLHSSVFLRTRCRARSRRTCKDEVRKAVAGGVEQTAGVDFVRHDPGAEILAVVNRLAVNKPGDMRSAVASGSCRRSRVSHPASNPPASRFDGHLFENIEGDRARHDKNRDGDKGRLGSL